MKKVREGNSVRGNSIQKCLKSGMRFIQAGWEEDVVRSFMKEKQTGPI